MSSCDQNSEYQGRTPDICTVYDAPASSASTRCTGCRSMFISTVSYMYELGKTQKTCFIEFTETGLTLRIKLREEIVKLLMSQNSIVQPRPLSVPADD